MSASTHSLVLGDIPLGKLFFMRLDNAFALSRTEDMIALVSVYGDLEAELRSYCSFKGESFVEKRTSKGCFTYILQKRSDTNFIHLLSQGESCTLDALAPDTLGLSARGSIQELGSPRYNFTLNSKDEIWSKNITKLHEDSKNAQWNATYDIAWNEIPTYNDALEKSIARIMTYLVENEFCALYVPAKFLSHISPYYHEVPLLLSSIIGDEARHIEAFSKRAFASGGLQYSTRTTQQSLYTLFQEKNYFKSSFLLHIMGEGTFIDLLHFLETHAKDEPTKKLLCLARRDEMRHVAYGMSNIKNALGRNPHKIELIKDVVFKRKQYLDELSGESNLLLESLCVFAGGGDSVREIKIGFEKLEALKLKMQKNRTKRLMECGIAEELADDLSKAHTPNFM